MEGLVTKDIIPSLQKALAMMSLGQREQIAINVEDIYFSFPYQVNITCYYLFGKFNYKNRIYIYSTIY